MKKIGERLESVRGSLGVVAFAEALGVNRKTVQRWEAGLAVPDGNSLLLLKEKFGVDPSWLLTADMYEAARAEQVRAAYGIEISAADEVALIQTYREIDPEARVTLQNLLKVIATAGHAEKAVKVPKAEPAMPKTAKVYSGERTGQQPKVEDRIEIRTSERPSKKFTPPKKRGGEG